MSTNREISADNLLDDKEDPLSNLPICILLLVAILMIAYNYFFSFIKVDGTSMQNTLQPDQFIFFVNHGYTVKRGDIVTIDDEKEGKLLIKRVIALEGDRIIFMKSEDGYVDLYLCQSGQTHFSIVNEKDYIAERMRFDGIYKSLWDNVKLVDYYPSLTEIYISTPNSEYERYILNECSIEIPKNGVYFLGDNRNHSGDSREEKKGIMYLSDVTGKMLKIIGQDSSFGKFLDFLY